MAARTFREFSHPPRRGHPALLVALQQRGSTAVTEHAGDVARLGLGAGHAAEARRDKELVGEGRVLRIEVPSGIGTVMVVPWTMPCGPMYM